MWFVRALGFAAAVFLASGCGTAVKKEDGSVEIEARLDAFAGGKGPATDCIQGSLRVTASKDVEVMLEADGPTENGRMTVFDDAECSHKIESITVAQDSPAVRFYVMSGAAGDATLFFYPKGETKKASLPVGFYTVNLQLARDTGAEDSKAKIGSWELLIVSLKNEQDSYQTISPAKVVSFTAKGDVYGDKDCKTNTTGDVTVEAYLEAFQDITGSLTITFE